MQIKKEVCSQQNVPPTPLVTATPTDPQPPTTRFLVAVFTVFLRAALYKTENEV
jgi:hypothetical protein